MKVLLITDTHLGARGANQLVAEYQARFFHEQLFPYIKENKREISCIIHLGDLFDQRKYLNYQNWNFWIENFIEPMNSFDLNIHLICGNHDVFYRETNKLNSPTLLLKNYNNFSVFSEATTIEDYLYIPWANKENLETTKKEIQKTKAKYAFGHLELAGFQVMNGVECQHSDITSGELIKFEQVFSGHFHMKHGSKNINYLGCPFELNWSDADQPKGFHTFDMVTGQLDFIRNELHQYTRLYYDDTNESVDMNFDSLSDKFVKLIVNKKTNPYLYNQYLQKLNEANPIQLQIVEQEIVKTKSDGSSAIDIKDIPTIIKNNIEGREIEENVKGKLIEYMSTLYQRTIC